MKIQNKEVSDEQVLEWLIHAYRSGRLPRQILEMLEMVSAQWDRPCRTKDHIDREGRHNISQ